ncbi:MAG: SDR family oxidoreductase [Pseudomonadales bacterium]|jgi:NAD(P)-dependent dehydrogenase (short-subunit alcohol dehydrogenase family)|nr:SDR family oxidoreductase [Pseudomonadales bacterium]MCP5320455.1 SDR family oxidoreductase [Pseudomonadales bacterium]MCP5336787.1 SDR family oxidoreductase [Pseudomonadales bacterium]
MAFHGKVALVTGGASGMGRISALRLAASGAQVAILDMNEAALAETAARFPNIRALRCNVADQEQVQACVAAVERDLGAIDRLTHAAGIMPSHTVMDTTFEQAQRLIEVNYYGTLHMIGAVVPAMLARNRGDVILFGSVSATALTPHLGAYAASKAAVNVIGETLANELGHTALRIAVVMPPAVNTPLMQQSLATDAAQALREANTSGRLNDPEKIVDQIETAFERGRKAIYPGEAKLLEIWHTLAPRSWWKTVLKYEKH